MTFFPFICCRSILEMRVDGNGSTVEAHSSKLNIRLGIVEWTLSVDVLCNPCCNLNEKFLSVFNDPLQSFTDGNHLEEDEMKLLI